MMLTLTNVITLFFGLAPIFGWYVFLEKRSQYYIHRIFTSFLYYCFVITSSLEKLEIDIVNNIAFFIVLFVHDIRNIVCNCCNIADFNQF